MIENSYIPQHKYQPDGDGDTVQDRCKVCGFDPYYHKDALTLAPKGSEANLRDPEGPALRYSSKKG